MDDKPLQALANQLDKTPVKKVSVMASSDCNR